MQTCLRTCRPACLRLPPDRGQACELRIETGTHPMPRSRPKTRKGCPEGKLDEFCKQVVVFALKPDGTWCFCQDSRWLNMKNIFFPLVEIFCPFFKHFAQLGFRLPRL